MRILHVVTLVDDQASYGGAVTVAVNQCIELRRRGHDARIVAGWRGTGRIPTELEGVPAHLFRVRPVAPGLGFSSLFSSALLRWVDDQARSYDVAHVHLARDLVPLATAAVLRRAGVPYVVQTHGSLRPDPRQSARLLDRALTRRTLLGARHTFALTPEERDAIIRVSGTPEGISLLRNGIVLPDRVPERRTEGPADVLFLGRLQADRRVMSFAAAAERLVADGVEATFSVVGPDGGQEKALRRFIAARPQLRGRLRYEGPLPHDRAVRRLRQADLYAHPSVDGQASPMSLLEALAAGVPSICTTSCGLAGTLAREGAAIVANPTDDALYGAIRRLLTDRGARARLSARAAATAASMFSMAAVAEVLEEEYGGTGASHQPAAGDRQSILWISPEVTPAHVEVWDALRGSGTLTVALLDDRTGSALDVGGEGRGYTVLPIPFDGVGMPSELRRMIRDRPDVVVLEGDHEGIEDAVARWTRRVGVHLVRSSRVAGPAAAAARASLLPVRAEPVSLDLRGPRHTWAPRHARGADVIDLQARTAARGPRHA